MSFCNAWFAFFSSQGECRMITTSFMLAGFQSPSLSFRFNFHIIFYSFSQAGLLRPQTSALKLQTVKNEPLIHTQKITVILYMPVFSRAIVTLDHAEAPQLLREDIVPALSWRVFLHCPAMDVCSLLSPLGPPQQFVQLQGLIFVQNSSGREFFI